MAINQELELPAERPDLEFIARALEPPASFDVENFVDSVERVADQTYGTASDVITAVQHLREYGSSINQPHVFNLLHLWAQQDKGIVKAEYYLHGPPPVHEERVLLDSELEDLETIEEMGF